MTPQSLDLGLSLGLTSQPSLCSSSSSPWNYAITSIVEQEVRPAAAEERASSPGSPLSSGSGKRAERSAVSDDDDGCDGGNARKKLRLSKDQAAVLEECFKTHSTLTPKQKLALANSLNLRPRQVEVWFQNRRARTKLKQTEVDCEYLKRWCEQLAEENRRLEKEVAELRALKAAPPPLAGAAPLTTLTMCLSCQRVGSSSTDNVANISAATNIVAANLTASPVMLHGHQRPFFCGFRKNVGAAYSASSGLVKVVKAAR